MADKTAAKDAEEKAEADFSTLTEDLATLRADVARLAETLTALMKVESEAVTDTVKQKVREGRARAEAGAADLYDEGVATLRDARERAETLTGEVADSIERNPFTAVVIALGLGYVFGALTRSRN